MRENFVKQKLMRNEISMGVMCMEFATTGIGTISAVAGAEFAVYDMEHTAWGLETIKMLTATAPNDLVPLIRVPTTDYHHIAHALDAGAMGLVIPLVKDAEHAKFAVECAQYPPRGRRGCAFAIAHDQYQGGNLRDKIEHINNNIMMIAQIETAEGLDNVEAIAAVDGIDALWIGQFDLTTSLGIPAQFDHPRFIDATKRIVDACHQHGKAATLAVMNQEELANGPSQGFRLLVYAADLWIYQQALRQCFRLVRERNGLSAK